RPRCSRRHHVSDVLRCRQFCRRLRPGRKSIHSCRTRRHWLTAGSRYRWHPDRTDRNILVRVFFDRLQGRCRLFSPGDNADLPATRPVRPAGCRNGLRWQPWPPTKESRSVAQSSGGGAGAPAQRVDVARSIRDAAITGLLAFGLFLPLVGFETITNIRNELVLATRWPLLLAIAALVALGRLSYSLFIEPWLARRALQPPSTAIPEWRLK